MTLLIYSMMGNRDRLSRISVLPRVLCFVDNRDYGEISLCAQ